MYILCIEGNEDQGAYAVANSKGDKLLLMFEEEDDAIRYAGLLEAEDFIPLSAVQVDPDGMIEMCEKTGYDYMIISSDELIIPPSSNQL